MIVNRDIQDANTGRLLVMPLSHSIQIEREYHRCRQQQGRPVAAPFMEPYGTHPLGTRLYFRARQPAQQIRTRSVRLDGRISAWSAHVTKFRRWTMLCYVPIWALIRWRKCCAVISRLSPDTRGACHVYGDGVNVVFPANHCFAMHAILVPVSDRLLLLA